jgi:LysM repeat protein
MRTRMRIISTLGAGALITGLAAGPALASTHTVQAGDTLSGIAAQAGVSLQRVQAANPQISDPDVITVGQLVNVPDGQPGTTSPAPTAPSTGTSTDTSTGTSTSGTSSDTGTSTSTGTSSDTGTSTSTSTGSAPSSYQSCVAWRESSNNPSSPAGLYGILPSTWSSLGYSGTAGQASVDQQNEAFQRLYSQYGTQPWSPYDGC